jgi:beta-lactamase superfamily II metal-dependent hydrolase
MYDVDFLPVGDTGQSGDAIALRFTRADNDQLAHVIVDAGFQDDGEAMVQHVLRWYQTTEIDLAIVTHPDRDHMGGMATVLEELNVAVLAVHLIGQHGGSSLAAAGRVNELVQVARRRGTRVVEPFTGDTAFGGLTILGPDPDWYDDLVAEQVAEEAAEAGRRAPPRVRTALRAASDRVATFLPVEIPFDDGPGTNPRNNTSVITLLELDRGRLLLTGDAGVSALERAWDWLELNGSDTGPPTFIQIPHAGSRRNASSAILNRILGSTNQPETRTAFVSVASQSVKHPSPRVINAYIRRGCGWRETRGKHLHHFTDAPLRGWPPAPALPPLDESLEED